MKKTRKVTKKSNLVKSEFLSNIIHEIQTPLTVIIGISELLSKTNLSIKQLKYVNILETISKNLLNLINNTLDFSKIKESNFKLENIRFNIYETIKQVYNTMLILANKKNLNLSYKISSKIPKILYGEPF